MNTSIALILCIVGLVVALLACEQPQDSAEELEEAHSGSWPPVLDCAHGGYCSLTPADKQILASLPVGPDKAESFAEFIRELDVTCASAP